MATDLKELRNQRGRIVREMNEINDSAMEQERDLTPEERTKWDSLDKEQESRGNQVERSEKQASLNIAMIAVEDPTTMQQNKSKAGERDLPFRETSECREIFHRYLTGGPQAVTQSEARAMQADSDTVGGYLVAPMEFISDLIKFVDDLVFIRQLATIVQVTTSDSLGVPSLDTDISDSDWTSELLTGTEDSSLTVGRRELHPHPLAKLIKVSNKLIRVSSVGIETLIRERMGYKFAVTEEAGFLTGTGAAQPLGVFTASSDGISTGQDVSTGNTTTSIGADGLIEAKYALKPQYWANAKWVFHRDALKQIRKLKDGNGQYLWMPGLQSGQPDRVLDSPFLMSEFAPNTFTTGLYVGIIGDFRHYWIAEALTFQVQRLVELYAATNQVGFIGRAELDGMPVLEEAFVRVTLA